MSGGEALGVSYGDAQRRDTPLLLPWPQHHFAFVLSALLGRQAVGQRLSDLLPPAVPDTFRL